MKVTFNSLAYPIAVLLLVIGFSSEVAAQEVPVPLVAPTVDDAKVIDQVMQQFHGSDLRGKDGPMTKAGHHLLDVYHRYASASSSEAKAAVVESSLAKIAEDMVAIDAIASTNGRELLLDLQRLGLKYGATADPIVSGWLPIHRVDEAAQLSSLRSMRPAIAESAVGDVTSLGDAAMRSDVARADLNVDGSGVKVGVISDSYNQDFDFGTRDDAEEDIASGDLPPTTRLYILDDSSIDDPIDEGRAMMQIVRDIAPGASQAFHSGFPGTASMIDAIRDLAAANCDIIVDDLSFLKAPFFQDGPIAQVADSVANSGIAYFSSAGNSADQSFEDTFRGASTSSGRIFHDFDTDEGAADVYQPIILGVGESVRIGFQWSAPYGSAGIRSPENDLDIFLVNDTLAIEASSTEPNLTDPVEFFVFENDGSIDANEDGFADTVFHIAIELFSGDAPDRIKYIDFNGKASPLLYDTNSSTSFGHPNAANVAGVAAASYADTPEFGTDPATIRSYSSRGGTPIYFDKDGNALSSPKVRLKPDFTAPDGADNTFFGSDTNGDGFPNFTGTSAAAPHAAGVAALMLNRDPGLTPEEIYESLRASVLDMDDPGTTGFDTGFDFRTGYGLIQADAASPLPVELADFEARTSGEAVTVSWRTLTETNNVGFDIERRVGEGGNWTTLQRIAGAGTTTEAQTYRFTDTSLPYAADALTYRLRQVDVDGTNSVSDEIIVTRNLDALELLGTYPNPARAQASVRFAVPEGTEDVRLSLYDVLGRNVQSIRVTQNGRQTMMLDTAGLASGIYFLRLMGDGQTRTQKLTIVR